MDGSRRFKDEKPADVVNGFYYDTFYSACADRLAGGDNEFSDIAASDVFPTPTLPPSVGLRRSVAVSHRR